MSTFVNFGGGGSDTSVVTAEPADVLENKIFIDNEGQVQVGTMPNNGSYLLVVTYQNQLKAIPQGYTNNFSYAKAEIENLSADNIAAGVEVGRVEGTFTSDASASSNDILSGKTAYVNGQKLTGNIVSIDSINKILSNQNATYNIPRGYHDGTGTVKAVITNLTASNIKSGITVGGISGTFTSDATAVSSDIKNSKTAYVDGKLITGSMPIGNIGTKTLTKQNESYTIPSGYYDGTDVVKVSISNLTAANIKYNVNVGGVTGTFTSDATATAALVVSGYTFYKSGTKYTGSMTNRSASTNAVSSAAASSSQIKLRIPKGAYNTTASSGYPEILMNFNTLLNQCAYGVVSSTNSYLTNVNSFSNFRRGNSVSTIAGQINLNTPLYKTNTTTYYDGNTFYYCLIPCWIASSYVY